METYLVMTVYFHEGSFPVGLFNDKDKLDEFVKNLAENGDQDRIDIIRTEMNGPIDP